MSLHFAIGACAMLGASSTADFLYNPPGLGTHAHCASIALSSDGHLFVAWYAYPGDDDFKDARIVFTRKLQGSPAWEKARDPFGAFGSSAGNPILFLDRKTNILWMLFVLLKGNYWNDAVLHSSYSLDLGVTWSLPFNLGLPKGYMTRHPPLEVADKLLLPAYDEISQQSILMQRSGATWREYLRFHETKAIQAALVRDSHGHLAAFFRPVMDPPVIWRAHSSDEAKSWSRLIQTSLPCPLSGISAFSAPGKLAVVYNHSTEHKRFPLSLSTSSDGGVSWSNPFSLDSSTFEVSYPSFVTDQYGWTHGVYTFNRRMIKYVSFPLKDLP